jgi:hypothetical protein
VPFSRSTLSWLVLLAVVLAALALVLATAAWQRAARRPTADRPARRTTPARDPSAPLTAAQVAADLDALQAAVSSSLRHLAVVRYDAFGDMGGHLSWSMALLDDGGDGVVLTSIHGRSDSRTYAKNVAAWAASSQLSPEEEEAINFARTGTS